MKAWTVLPQRATERQWLSAGDELELVIADWLESSWKSPGLYSKVPEPSIGRLLLVTRPGIMFAAPKYSPFNPDAWSATIIPDEPGIPPPGRADATSGWLNIGWADSTASANELKAVDECEGYSAVLRNAGRPDGSVGDDNGDCIDELDRCGSWSDGLADGTEAIVRCDGFDGPSKGEVTVELTPFEGWSEEKAEEICHESSKKKKNGEAVKNKRPQINKTRTAELTKPVISTGSIHNKNITVSPVRKIAQYYHNGQ